jgi:hypothetical protein
MYNNEKQHQELVDELDNLQEYVFFLFINNIIYIYIYIYIFENCFIVDSFVVLCQKKSHY